MKKPSRDEWANLYKSARQFQEIAPWKWMANEDVFAICNPGTGEIGYSSILGIGE